ncbi:MAG: hypothetical protein ACRDA8_12350, partial [Shewanella sp.]
GMGCYGQRGGAPVGMEAQMGQSWGLVGSGALQTSAPGQPLAVSAYALTDENHQSTDMPKQPTRADFR